MHPILKGLYENLEVRCENVGCNEVFAWPRLADHQAVCEFISGDVRCNVPGCTFVGPIEQMSTHDKEFASKHQILFEAKIKEMEAKAAAVESKVRSYSCIFEKNQKPHPKPPARATAFPFQLPLATLPQPIPRAASLKPPKKAKAKKTNPRTITATAIAAESSANSSIDGTQTSITNGASSSALAVRLGNRMTSDRIFEIDGSIDEPISQPVDPRGPSELLPLPNTVITTPLACTSSLLIIEDRLFCGYISGHIVVWDLNTNECLNEFQGHSHPIDHLASPSQHDINHDRIQQRIDHLFTVSCLEKVIKIWDIKTITRETTIRCVKSISFDVSRISCIAIPGHTSELKHLFTGHSTQSHIRVNMIGNNRKSVIHRHTGGVLSLLVYKDRLYSGSKDTLIHVLDHATFNHLGTLQGHTKEVSGMDITTDGMKLCSYSLDKSIKVWDTTSYTCLATIQEPTSHPVSLVISGNRIYVGLSNFVTIRIYDINNYEHISDITMTTRGVKDIGIHNNRLFVGSKSGTIKIYYL